MQNRPLAKGFIPNPLFFAVLDLFSNYGEIVNIKVYLVVIFIKYDSTNP